MFIIGIFKFGKYKKPSVSDIFQGTSDKLIICSSNFDEWSNSYTRVKFNCFYKETQNDFNNCSIKNLDKILENKIPEKFINGLNNFRCFKSPEGYYLNKDELIYEECYSSCKTCEQKGNSTFHNCIICKENYRYRYTFDFSDYINCYDVCPDYYYLDEITNEKHCTRSCPENYSKLIFNKTQCIKNCLDDPIYRYEYNNTCYDKFFYTTEIISTYQMDEIITTEKIIYNDKTFDTSELINFKNTESIIFNNW